MEAPLHKACGTRHWSNQPCPLNEKTSEDDVVKAVKTKQIKSSSKPDSTSPAKAKKGEGTVIRKSTKPSPEPKAKRSGSSAVERRTSKARVAGSKPARITKPAGSLTPENVKRSISRATKAIKKAEPKRMGRPRKTPDGFDKKAYMKDYMKTYRAKRAAKKAKRIGAARLCH